MKDRSYLKIDTILDIVMLLLAIYHLYLLEKLIKLHS